MTMRIQMHLACAMIAAMSMCATITTRAAERFIHFNPTSQAMAIAQGGHPLTILYDTADYEGIKMAISCLQDDFLAVTGQKAVAADAPQSQCIIVGSLGSAFINKVIESGGLDATQLEGKREKYLLQVVDNPMAGVQQALVIAGSDKRGTIYGIYELSRQMGVSPWYWWMDAPIAHHDDIYVVRGTFTDGEPKVAYRGIFINDEHPCYKNWVTEKFGGFNSQSYEKVFELILRLKGNFMWPAMWANAFYDDDPMNGVIADRMGIVMGTSHHEPMCLNQQDWYRQGQPGGKWDYTTNSEGLTRFWTGGITRAKDWEKVVTVGMRGDGDKPMDGSGNIALLERIIDDQRQIISQVTGRPAEETPQVWALYKEVQDYYDHGMKVPDDVILMLCDDNWGNVRRLPPLDPTKRHPGGYAMYYHVDYVGGPRCSKWMNISPIPRMWEQLNLTYSHGVDRIWVLNVGDLKPMEYPITFFLDMAWDPERFTPDNLREHSENFCREIFGEDEAVEAARLLRTYAKYNRRMIPELLSTKTFSSNYNEWERVVAAYDQLALDAVGLKARLPEQAHSAWLQLLGYPVQACANLYDMYYAQLMNQKLAKAKKPEANLWADRVGECFARDAALADEYHHVNGGKWNHMAEEVNMGYTTWSTPKTKVMPAVTRVNGDTLGLTISLPVPAAEQYSEVDDHPVFVERDGYVSIEAQHFTRATDGKDVRFAVIPEMGRTLSAVTTLPCTVTPEDGMVLEYDMDITSSQYARVSLRFSATLNYQDDHKGHSYAVSFDDEEAQTVNINGDYNGELGQLQRLHVIDSETVHTLTPGRHTLRVRLLDAGLCLQKITVDLGGKKRSFLGPEETINL